MRTNERRRKRKQRSFLRRRINVEPLELLPESASRYINYNEFVVKKTGCIARIFENHLGRLVYTLKLPIIVIALLWFCTAIYFGMNIPRMANANQLLSSDQPI